MGEIKKAEELGVTEELNVAEEIRETEEIKKNYVTLIGNRVFSSIAGIGTIILLVIFPLYYKDYYKDILDVKYQLCYVTVLVMAGLMILAAAVLAILDLNKYNGYGVKQFLNKISIKNIRNIITIPDVLMLTLLSVMLISTLQSEYLYESFWGNEGRYSGMFLWIIYGVCYICISKFLKFKKWYYDLFLVAGMLVCLFGITNFFKIDFLGFKAGVDPKIKWNFTSTIGNINSYTAYVGIVLGVASTLFAIEKNVLRSVGYYLCMLISFFALIMGVSDNAFLSLGALLCFLPLYLFGYRRGFKRYFIILATFFSVVQCISFITQRLRYQVLEIDGFFQLLGGFDKLGLVITALWSVTALLYAGDLISKRDENSVLHKRYRIAWLCIISISIAVGIYVLYDANIGGGAEKYGSLAKYLVINDSWGSNRGYVWRIAMEAYREFPLHQKLFGFGLETFGIIVYESRGESSRLFGEIFDNAHNEYLQYLVTIGLIGISAYLLFIGSSLVRMIKKAPQSPYIMPVVFAVLCYSAQALVNLHIPIVAPVFMTLLMIGLSESNNRNVQLSDTN